MQQGTSPTLRLWQLAEALRGYRERAKLTIDQAGKDLKPLASKWSRSKVQRIEARLYAPKPVEVEQMATAYGISKDELAPLIEMSKDARVKGWWQSSALPQQYHTLVGLERSAETLRQYEVSFVPGLLQTPAYVRALITSIERSCAPEELEGMIAARLTRQHVFNEQYPPQLHVILAESVLRWPVGGKQVMAEQIQHLLEAVSERKTVLQILPFSVGANPGLEGPFTVMTLPQIETDLVYVEGMMGAVYLESQDDVRTCVMRFASLTEQALSPTSSTKFLRSILAGYT